MDQYTKSLFDLLIKHQPVGAPEEAFEDARRASANTELTDDELEQEMIQFGKAAWPYWQAEEAFFDTYGKVPQTEFFMEFLEEPLNTKWNEFTASGGSFSGDVQKFEEAFTPEENNDLQQALLKAKGKAMLHVRGLAREEKKQLYEDICIGFIERKNEMLEMLEELERLKDTGNKWDEEIDDEIQYFLRGFALLEERPTPEKIQGKIDFYKGQIEAGNKNK